MSGRKEEMLQFQYTDFMDWLTKTKLIDDIKDEKFSPDFIAACIVLVHHKKHVQD